MAIKQLAPEVFNMIAAGEVVERPASVVKELCENAVDAGASEVDIEIEHGGILKIRISDDGTGILPDELEVAFLPHATSKLTAAEDISVVSTLGFRGEALSSIASVSRIEMQSKAASEDGAAMISLAGGRVLAKSAASRAKGTVITVSELFFNTPARLKFLKKPLQEQHAVADAVKELILSNPSVAFTLTADGERIFTHEGGELIDAVYSVYDTKLASSLIEVNYEAQSGIRVRGYVSRHDAAKPNRTYQTVIINGRSVKDRTVTLAAEKAYTDYLMKRNYPVLILDIVMPFDSVDVNVHPAKTEVRFADKNAVFSAVYRAVNNAVERSISENKINISKSPSVDAEADKSIATAPSADTKTAEKTSDFAQMRMDTSALYSQLTQPKNVSFKLNDPRTFKSTVLSDSSNTLYSHDIASKPSDVEKCGIMQDNSSDFHAKDAVDYVKNAHINDYSDIKNHDQKDFTHSCIKPVFDGKVVGQVFDTYILCELDGVLYIIDQHAAHERVLYDKLKGSLGNGYAQPLLIPIKLRLSAQETEFILKVMPQLIAMGFEIEYKSGAFMVYQLPDAVIDMDTDKFFASLLKDLDAETLDSAELFKDKVARQACRAAIKGGESLTREQIYSVVNNLIDENGELPLKCPHGRPAVIAVEKRDIEKMFKRIV